MSKVQSQIRTASCDAKHNRRASDRFDFGRWTFDFGRFSNHVALPLSSAEDHGANDRQR
jgi:hypothetical protein